MRNDGLRLVSNLRVRLLFHRVHVAGDADGCGDDDEIFDDVLTDERRNEKG